MAERFGVEGAPVFGETGAIRDVVQNQHVAGWWRCRHVEPPTLMYHESVRG